ncbi:Ras-related protein Rab-5B [Durusdinium trenchii]|uniref:Ras-related protein Rab-5B n=1 Tax=Durusdinium trenchii TaxID=1381693 RepID=A0ABP0SF03_9DINO
MAERRFKLVILGTMGVGKTCLTLRFVKGLFDDDQLPTIGAAYMTQKLESNGKQFIFEIWDTAGQERYEAITPLYYRSAEAAVIVFDLTYQESFQKAKEWLKRLRKERPDPDMPIALVGNKCDREGREVDDEAVQTFVEENNLKYFETSAKTGENVDDMFAWVATSLPPPAANMDDATDAFPVSPENTTAEQRGCC